MSVAEHVVAQTPAVRRRPSGRFLRSELRLIFFRRRNQAGLLVLAGVPIADRHRGEAVHPGP